MVDTMQLVGLKTKRAILFDAIMEYNELSTPQRKFESLTILVAYMSNNTKQNYIFFERTIFLWELFLVFRCIYGCQKWIPDKIPHRNDNPIFFLNFFFSLKKNIFWKWEKIFFEKKKVFHFQNHFFSVKKKVEKKIGSSFRCGILSGIHFWHP